MKGNAIPERSGIDTGKFKRKVKSLIKISSTAPPLWTLSGHSVITFQDPPEFALATDGPFRFRNEMFVQDCVVPTDTAMGSLLMIMFEPHAKDTVELRSTETDKEMQTFALRAGDEAFRKRICLGRPYGNANTLHIRFPKLVELVRKLPVSVVGPENSSAFVFRVVLLASRSDGATRVHGEWCLRHTLRWSDSSFLPLSLSLGIDGRGSGCNRSPRKLNPSGRDASTHDRNSSRV
jgi:hypothetical protein